MGDMGEIFKAMNENSKEKRLQREKYFIGRFKSIDAEQKADGIWQYKDNVDALIKKIKENGGDKKIIKEYKQKQFIGKRAENTRKETQDTIKLYESFKQDSVLPETCVSWQELGKKFGIKK